ncbi:MAG: hypothetical protein RL885_09155 [Planctomycetota bacterium]
MTTSEQPNTTDTTPPAEAKADPQAHGLDRLAQEVHDRLQDRAKELGSAAAAWKPFTQGSLFEDLPKLRSALTKLDKEALRLDAEGAEELIGKLRSFEKDAQNEYRQTLGRKLKAACDEAGLSLRVISREHPIEVRIPPFAVKIDFEKGRADFLFARLPLDKSAAQPKDILVEHTRLLKSMNSGFIAEHFFEKCHRAWRAARAALGDGSERVEILDFLPYLAVELQSDKFRLEPSVKNFEEYSRVQFAWDVLRLRREKKLTQNGIRLNLGVATGSTASQKKRVIYFEDEEGNGEYKLTIFFTRVEESAS